LAVWADEPEEKLMEHTSATAANVRNIIFLSPFLL
jgi:hypothetical protein